MKTDRTRESEKWEETVINGCLMIRENQNMLCCSYVGGVDRLNSSCHARKKKITFNFRAVARKRGNYEVYTYIVHHIQQKRLLSLSSYT